MGKTSNYKYASVMVPKQNQQRSDNSRVVEDQEDREGVREGASLTTKCWESRKPAIPAAGTKERLTCHQRI